MQGRFATSRKAEDHAIPPRNRGSIGGRRISCLGQPFGGGVQGHV